MRGGPQETRVSSLPEAAVLWRTWVGCLAGARSAPPSDGVSALCTLLGSWGGDRTLPPSVRQRSERGWDSGGSQPVVPAAEPLAQSHWPSRGSAPGQPGLHGPIPGSQVPRGQVQVRQEGRGADACSAGSP